MAGRDAQSRPDEIANQRRWYAFRSQGYNRAAAVAEALQRSQILRVRHANLRFEMNALASLVKRRALQVKTEHTRNLQQSRRDRRQARHDIGAIGDQRGQAACGPTLPMGLDDSANSGLGW